MNQVKRCPRSGTGVLVPGPLQNGIHCHHSGTECPGQEGHWAPEPFLILLGCSQTIERVLPSPNPSLASSHVPSCHWAPPVSGPNWPEWCAITSQKGPIIIPPMAWALNQGNGERLHCNQGCHEGRGACLRNMLPKPCSQSQSIPTHSLHSGPQRF